MLKSNNKRLRERLIQEICTVLINSKIGKLN